MLSAYDRWSARQQRAATIVYDPDDIRRVVTKCALAGTPCNLVLGDNIIATTGFTFPSGLPSLTIDCGGRYKFIVAAAITTLFACRCSTVFFDLAVVVKTGASITTVWEAPDGSDATKSIRVERALVLPSDLTSYSVASVTNLFGTSGTNALCTAHDITSLLGSNLFREDTGATWQGSSFTNIGGAGFTLGIGANSPKFLQCRFDAVGAASIYINANGSENVFDRLDAPSITNPGTGFNIFGGSFPSSATLSRLDALVCGGGARAITVNSAGPTISPTVYDAFLRLTHGASASGIVTIAAGRDGQQLTLYFVSVAGTAVYTDGSGNLELASNFTPTSADTLSLIYDAGTSKWVETGRSVN